VPTRFYLTNTPSPVSPVVSPPGAQGWEADFTTGHLALSTTKGGANTSATGSETSSTTSWDVCLGQWVSPPLVGSGTVQGLYAAALARQGTTGTLQRSRIIVRVVSGDGQIERGFSLSGGAPDGVFWTSSALIEGMEGDLKGGTVPVPVAYQDGDRLVIELGYRSFVVGGSATLNSGTIWFGGTGSPDISVDDDPVDTALPAWIDLPDELVFAEDVPPVEGVLDATLPAVSANLSGTVRANVILGGTLPVATAALTGAVRATGTLTGLLPELTAGLNGTVTTAGVLDASLPPPTGAIDGTTNTGRVSGTLPEPFANLSGGVRDTAALDAVLPELTASVDGDVTATGGLDAALPSPAAELIATVFAPGGGFLSASLPMPTAGLDATVAVVAVIHGTLPEPAAAFDAAVRLAAVLDASLPVPTAELEATTTQPESHLDAILPIPTAALVAAASTSGVLAATLPLPTGALAGFPPPTYTPPLHAGEPSWGGAQLHAGSPDMAVGYVAGKPLLDQ
jgi:hypothetical protein